VLCRAVAYNVPGIADGGGLVFRPPGTVARLFAKDKYLVLKIGFIRPARTKAQQNYYC